MASVNKVILVGNVGKDPESRTFANGNSVVTFSLATSDTWKDKNGEKQERTEWHNVAVFNEGLGGIIERYVRKGSKIYIEGSLQTRKWQDQSGNDRYSTEIVLQKFRGEVCLLDGPQGGGRGGDSGGRDGGARDNRGGGVDDKTRDTHGFGGGRSSDERPRQTAFDTDLDDDVPF